VLDPPLRGGPWIAAYDPAMNGGHRRALFTIEGKARIPARFAIDWIKVDGAGLLSYGDASSPRNWSGYGQDVLAVADAEVVAVVSDLPEPTTPIGIENAAGNYVTLSLGGGRFAAYEHLQTGSVRVRTGDRVRSGQVIALLGGSGSVSSGPHLHFHVSNANSPLGAEGVPWVFRRFERLGGYASIDGIRNGAPWTPLLAGQSQAMTMTLPAPQTVLRF
jgi:hypothetical protein